MSYIKESAQFLDWIEREGQYYSSGLDFNYNEQQYLQQLIQRDSSNRGSTQGAVAKARISDHPTQDDSKESRRQEEVRSQQATKSTQRC